MKSAAIKNCLFLCVSPILSAVQENLMVVKVTLDDKRHFLTSLCQRGLPARATGTGYRSPPRDVEIDTHFAKQLGIMSAHKTEVCILYTIILAS